MLNWLSNLRVRFLGLVVVAVLPALALLIFSASEQREQAIADARRDVQARANAAATYQASVIESTRQLLVVLSRLPEIQETGPACDSLMGQLNDQFRIYANLGVIDREGRLVCSAVPLGEPVNLGGERFVQNVFGTFAFSLSQYQLSPATGRQVLNGGFPIFDQAGTVTAVAYASIDLELLAAEYAAGADLPEGAVVTVFDTDGTALLRQPPLEGFVGASLLGTPIVPTVLAGDPADSADDLGIAEVRQLDAAGVERAYVYAYAPLAAGGQSTAFVSVARERDEVVREAEQAFSDNLTRLGLVVVVILIGTWVAADLLIRRNTDTHKVLVRRIYDAFGTGGTDLLDEVVAPDFRDHDPMPGQAPGLAGLKQAVGLFRAAFPDGEMLVDDMVAEGDKVVSRVTLRGTQRGTFFGLPASGKVVSAEGIEIYKIAGGRIVEGWSRFVPPLLEADEEEPEPAEATPPTAHAPELTLGSVARALRRAVLRRLPGGR